MNFNKLVKSIVQPILVSNGFTINLDSERILEYDYEIISITMSYDYGSSYEVDLTLLFKESGQFYGYTELKQYFDSYESTLSATQIVDETILINWLEGISTFLRQNLRKIILNNHKVEIGLKSIRQLEIDRYENEKSEIKLISAVDQYWADKDYFGLVNFLKHKGGLTGSVKKKYQFALKKLTGK